MPVCLALNDLKGRFYTEGVSGIIGMQSFFSAAAKSLQSCLTLRDPMDCSLPGSSVHGVFQARVLE